MIDKYDLDKCLRPPGIFLCPNPMCLSEDTELRPDCDGNYDLDYKLPRFWQCRDCGQNFDISSDFNLYP
jgi:aspartate carbamoyltransferase regulatory subunit